MNEMIYDMAQKAWDNTNKTHRPLIITKEFIKELSELIVLESSKWIVDNSSSMEQLGPEYFAMGLCKHFGVK